MGAYAKDTDVTVAASKEELARILERWGVENYDLTPLPMRRLVVLTFTLRGRFVRMEFPVPDVGDARFAPKGPVYTRTAEKVARQQQKARYEQELKDTWRGIVLSVKARLSDIELGFETVETAFMAHLLLPNGQTVGQWIGQVVTEAQVTGQMPALPSGGPPQLPPPRE